jgi:hypothetical protein
VNAARIDYAFHGVLERVIGAERANAFHPLNRHPMVFSEGLSVVEQFGGPDDGAESLRIEGQSDARPSGWDRIKSYWAVACDPGLRAEFQKEWLEDEDEEVVVTAFGLRGR